MTAKQAKAIDNLVGNGGNITQAMIAAGYSPATANMPQKLTQAKGVRELLDKILPDEEVIRKHADALNAMKWNEFSGEVVPDHAVRLRGVELVYKVKGYLKPDNESNTTDNSRNYYFPYFGDTDPFKHYIDAVHGADTQRSSTVSGTQLAPQGTKDNIGNISISPVGSQ